MVGHVVNGTSAAYDDLPPEIKHITEGYISFGTLIQRVVQLTWNELTETIESMAEMKAQGQNFSNGMFGRESSASDPSLEKRRRWLEFAKNHRERFIMLAVIMKWSKNWVEIGRFVDLANWANERLASTHFVGDKLGQLKLDMQDFKMLGPDVKTALEVLTTGKASWLPDLGLIPLPPLSSQKMLSTLQDMNVQLHIRLTLHEDLPYHLRQWTVASGRATFTFPGLFEFDVTISDEDPSTQLWFVELRFLFKPSATLPEGEMRDVLHINCDAILKNSGLIGCAEFLREFTLTHQITVLHQQAWTLLKGAWQSVIRLEKIHRSLILEYWAESSFTKSWIEFGIGSGKSKKYLPPGTVELPRITTRWKCYGEEPTDLALNLSLENMSMEQILKQAIAKHSSFILQTTKAFLDNAAGRSTVFSTQIEISDNEPVDCKLTMQLGIKSPKITLAIEQFSGRLTLHPANAISRRAEYDLNRKDQQGRPRHPTQDTAGVLQQYVCLDLIWRIERQVTFSGWDVVTNLRLAPDHLREKLGTNTLRWGIFKSWSLASPAKDWLFVLTVNLDHGGKWWAVEVNHSADRPKITAVQALPAASEAINHSGVDAAFMSNLEVEAAVCVTEYLASRQSRQLGTVFEISATGN